MYFFSFSCRATSEKSMCLPAFKYLPTSSGTSREKVLLRKHQTAAWCFMVCAREFVERKGGLARFVIIQF